MAEQAAGRSMVERRSGVALWRQMADRIRGEIAAGAFDDTGMLPAETALAARYGVNRHTVRAAIAVLADDGLVEPMQGRGTLIVRQPRLTLPIALRTRFSAGISDQAASPVTEVLADRIVEATPEAAHALAMAPGALCVEVEDLSLAGGRPICAAIHLFPADRFAGIAEAIAEEKSITRAFMRFGVTDYLRASTEITARHADAEERRRLALAPGAIVIETRAVNVDPDGRPIQLSRTRFAADRVAFRVES